MAQEVILDTSFIISCIKKKIDFFDELTLKGFKIIIPKQVAGELKGLKMKVALDILNVYPHKIVDLGTRNVDQGILRYAEENPEVVVATLDRAIKEETKNRKLIIRGEKKLEITE
jgi:rRNA-processing protein FCF1